MTNKYKEIVRLKNTALFPITKDTEHFMKQVNFDYADQNWFPLQVLMDKMVDLIFYPRANKTKDIPKKLQLWKLMIFIRIMMLMNKHGIFEVNCIGEEFADIIMEVEKSQSLEELERRYNSLGEYVEVRDYE